MEVFLRKYKCVIFTHQEVVNLDKSVTERNVKIFLFFNFFCTLGSGVYVQVCSIGKLLSWRFVDRLFHQTALDEDIVPKEQCVLA